MKKRLHPERNATSYYKSQAIEPKPDRDLEIMEFNPVSVGEINVYVLSKALNSPVV